jgi:hypothetical protein
MPFGKLQTFQGVRKEQQKLELELRVRNGPEDCELSQNLVRRMIADLMKVGWCSATTNSGPLRWGAAAHVEL